MPQKIIVITSIHPDFDARVWRHARSLVEQGCEVELICPWDVPSGSAIDGVIFRPFKRVRKRAQRLYLIPLRVSRELARLINRDVIFHFHDIDILPLMALISLRKTVVFDVHENYPDEMLVRTWIPAYLRSPLYHLVKWTQYGFGRLIKNIVLVTEAQKAYFPPETFNIIIIKNYATKEISFAAQSNYMKRDDAVLFIGSHYPINGSWLILDIAEALRDRGVFIKFLITDRFGNKGFRKDWINECSRRNLDAMFQLVPNVPPPKIMDHINRATIGINPVLRVEKQVKAINTKLFEFMAGGIPFVSSDLPFPSELVSKTEAGLLASPEDPSTFADAIVTLKDDRALAARLGARGQREFLQHFTWESQMPRLSDFYRGLRDD